MGAVSGSGTSTITFTVTGIPRGQTRNFYVGADFPIKDDTSGATGTAASSFLVSVQSSSGSGQAIATVFRSLNLAKVGNLVFGRILKPSSGTTTVTINATTGARTVAGGNGALMSGTSSRAAYTITGEGGQVVSIAVPSSITLTGPATVTVTTSTTAAASVTLPSAVGSGGSYSFGVGGSIAVLPSTPSGAYSGTFSVTAQYN
jgi:hypothetical protein